MRNITKYPRRKGLEERFWAKVERREPSDCWPWLAAKDKLGYGRFPNGRETLAHRWAYIFENGEIPDGLVIRHACDNPNCVNPAHLLVGTMKDNAADRDGRGRARYHSGDNHWRFKARIARQNTAMLT